MYKVDVASDRRRRENVPRHILCSMERGKMQKYMQKKRIFPACLFLMFVLMILVIGKETDMTGRGETQKIRNLSDGWYYLKDGERTEVTLPTTLQEDPGTVLELYNDTVTDENRDMVLLTWGAPYHLQIQMDGKTIYQYRDYGFKRNLQMARKLECRVTLPALHKSSQLCFLYTVPESGVCKLTPVYMGSSEAIFRFQIMNAAPVFVIVLGMLVLGIFAIGIYAYLRARKMTERRFASVGLFLLLCGIWCVTDSSLMQYLSHYSPTINEISFYAFMLMSVPVIRFVRESEGMQKYKSISVLIALFYLNVILQSICTYWFHVQLIHMLMITHLLLGGGCILLSVLLYREYKAVKNRQIYSLLMAFGVLAFVGVGTLVLYWFSGITGYDLIFEAGIVVFVSVLLWPLARLWWKICVSGRKQRYIKNWHRKIR